jgi:hypothetical protein
MREKVGVRTHEYSGSNPQFTDAVPTSIPVTTSSSL